MKKPKKKKLQDRWYFSMVEFVFGLIGLFILIIALIIKSIIILPVEIIKFFLAPNDAKNRTQ
jgi:hypothetical protein